MIVLERPAAPARVTPIAPEEQRLVLYNVGWETYERLCELLEPTGVRMTYDSGSLELMSPSRRHERYGHTLGRCVEVIAEELDVALEPGGKMTFRRRDVARGIEPDDCFWIAHEAEIRGKEEIDLTCDPPPDLFIEVEVTHSLLDRLATCAALCIPEVWRFDGEQIIVLCLRPDGTYQEVERSPTFPQIDLNGIVPFLKPDPHRDYLTTIREFREWVRDQIRKGNGHRA
ncbi:MAG TPA: Uma2 family endonuclease [Planctomycetaceae bacterium]|nr:Uma2 family endonuclease [Planctomycetaceae bacterium]